MSAPAAGQADDSALVDTQFWFDAQGRQTASFVESAWDTDALDAARRALGLALEIEPVPIPVLELGRLRSRASARPR